MIIVVKLNATCEVVKSDNRIIHCYYNDCTSINRNIILYTSDKLVIELLVRREESHIVYVTDHVPN